MELNLFSLSPSPSRFCSVSVFSFLPLPLPSFSFAGSFSFRSLCWVTFSVSVFPSLSLAVFCLRARWVDWWMWGWTDRRRAGSRQRVKNTLGLNINQATSSHIILYKQQYKSLCCFFWWYCCHWVWTDAIHSLLLQWFIHNVGNLVGTFVTNCLLPSKSCFYMMPDVVLNYLCGKSGLMHCTSGVTSKFFDKEVSSERPRRKQAAQHCGLSVVFLSVFSSRKIEQRRLLPSFKSRWCLLLSSSQWFSAISLAALAGFNTRLIE